MSCWRMLKRVATALVIASLWVYGAKILCSRAQIAFPSDSHAFWKGVILPDKIEMVEPILSTASGVEGELTTDPYSQALLRVVADPNSSCTTAVCDISALDRLCAEREDWLLRYLACNPSWRLYVRYDRLFAERRVRRGDQWHWQDWEVFLDGVPGDSKGDEFDMDFDTVESHSTICFGGLEFNWARCKSGGRVPLPLKIEGDDFNQIEAVCDGEKLSLDVYELTTFVTSRVVQAAFDLTQKEFVGVQSTTDWPQMKAILPEGSVRTAPASLEMLYQLTSRGEILNYAYQSWLNPGEPGKTYLRAFEVSQGVELGIPTSVNGKNLKNSTLEYVGWSDNPEEKFLVGCRIDLPGSRHQTYAVRLEVWFTPASGGPERKLVEKVFRVKGQER